MKKLKIAFVITILIFFASCSTTSKISDKNTDVVEQNKNELSLIFAGDIMAHRPNFSMKDFSKIWKDTKDIIQKSDFAFANIESPIDNTLDFSTYPNFNMQEQYPLAAINAGFNVFSTINNHSNDQALQGIMNTISWTEKIHQERKNTQRPVYFNGLNKIKNSEISYNTIYHKNWKIIFCAVTEILNRNDYKAYFNYVPYTEKGRNNFINYVNKIKTETNCDLFILSVHTQEPEYVTEVTKKRKEYFHKLLNNGVDIIWANHPHVIQEREIIGNKETNKLNKIIMYANGNTISGQRWEPQLENPFNEREYTGDGLLFFVKLEKDDSGIKINETKPYYITTYINTAWEFVTKKLDQDFIDYLNEVDRKKWATYIQKRKEICESTKENIIWQ